MSEPASLDAVVPDAEILAVGMHPRPQPTYLRMAEECPVQRGPGGSVTMLRMDDVLAVNRHRAVRTGTVSMGGERPAIPLGLDGPEHTKYRRLLDPVFAPAKVAPLEPKIRELAHQLIDRFVGDGEADLHAEWCALLPSTIFVSIMGLPLSDLPFFLEFNAIKGGHDTPEGLTADQLADRVAQAHRSMFDYLDQAFDQRLARATPGDDLLGWLMTTEVDGQRLSREDLLDITNLLMVAGLDTVTASLACILAYFAQHPEDRKRVVADTGLLPSAIEELMRFESPVPAAFRVAAEEVEIGGVTLEAGTRVVISWAAANLDPHYFPDPLRVDLERSPNPHVAFASGFHRCLGSHLARLEMRTAIEAFHERIPDYWVKPGHELEYTGFVRTPAPLPLVWR